MNEPVDRFLDRLRDRGVPDGVDLRRRVHEALALGGHWDLRRLRVTLRTILASDAEHRRTFDEEFERFFQDVPPSMLADLMRRTGERTPEPEKRDAPEPPKAPPPAPSPPSPGGTPPSLRALRRVVFGVVLCLSCVLLASQISWFREENGGAPMADAGVDAAPTAQVDPVPVPGGSSAAPTPPPPAGVPPSKIRVSWKLAVLGAMSGLVLLALGSDILRRARKKSDEELPAEPKINDERRDARPRSDPRPLTVRELRRLGQRVGLLPDEAHRVLDLGGTVRRSARMGGILDPMYHPVKAPAPVAVVVPPVLDMVAAALVADLLEKLVQAGIHAFRVERSAPLVERKLLMLAVVDASREPPWPARAWLRARGSHVALVEARDPALWGPEIARLPCAPFPPDTRGLLKAIDAAARGDPRRPAPLLRPPPEGLASLFDALPLAAACAVAEPCDLQDVDELRRRFFDHVAFSAIQRITALPGVTADRTGLRFRAALRDDLTRRLPAGKRREVLGWHRDRLLAQKEHLIAGSRALAVCEREIALADLQLACLDDSPDAARVEAAVTVLEQHLVHAGLRRRLDVRAREIAPFVTELKARVGQPSLRRRLLRLGLLDQAPEPTVTNIAARAPIRLAAAGILGALAVACAVAGAAVAVHRECGSALSLCNDLCTNVETDPHNCGACGHSCPEGLHCTAGACRCAPGQVECAGACADPTSDPAHCGSCETRCEEGRTCRAGKCTGECAAGRRACGDTCVDTSSDPGNCGACGVACGEGSVCAFGKCVSASGVCGGGVVDLSTDPHNCGKCGFNCDEDTGGHPRSGRCIKGSCEWCPPGYQRCNTAVQRCDTHVAEDLHNCGVCGHACRLRLGQANMHASCKQGTCSYECDTGYGDCNGNPDDGCEKRLDDVENCGACREPCSLHANANTSCTSFRCEWTCNAGWQICGDNLKSCDTYVLTDINHCGDCLTKCKAPAHATPTCANGKCGLTCDPPYQLCGGACVDTKSDSSNCGSCGQRCPQPAVIPGVLSVDWSLTCLSGNCVVICNPGMTLCNPRDVQDDPECKYLDNDADNCGSCGNACPPRANATARCVSKKCTFTCRRGFNDCDGRSDNGCEQKGPCPTCASSCDEHKGICVTNCALTVADLKTCVGECETIRRDCVAKCAKSPAGAP